METLSAKEWRYALLFTIALGFSLMGGFLPTALRLYDWTGLPSQFSNFAFPVLAVLFYFSLPRRSKGTKYLSKELLLTGVGALVIAAIFGVVHPAPPIPWSDSRALWYLVLAPVGEEFLFRGWVYAIVDYLWPKLGSLTNPLPAAVWLSAIGFSLWHLQNLRVDSPAFVLFQVGYTFFSGLWLGYLRWKSGSLWLPCAFHVGLNVASNVC